MWWNGGCNHHIKTVQSPPTLTSVLVIHLERIYVKEITSLHSTYLNWHPIKLRRYAGKVSK